jgi:hypothetical protein
MSENVTYIIGVLFDLYVKDLIKKETYDDCIRAYKEYIQSKDNLSITSDAGESFVNMHCGSGIEIHGKSIKVYPGVGESMEAIQATNHIKNAFVEEKHTIDGIDYEHLIQRLYNMYGYDKRYIDTFALKQAIDLVKDHRLYIERSGDK